MSDDLRRQRSESFEGNGRARRRLWDAYADAANQIRPRWWDDAFEKLGVKWTEELMGFWLSWHLYGGFEGLERAGWNERTIYRRLKRFRLVFGKHPDDYAVVGVDLDPEAFWKRYLAEPAKGNER